MDRIRILLADDHVPFRQGLRALLRSEADLEVVGQSHRRGRQNPVTSTATGR